jgi:hypothetical protein
MYKECLPAVEEMKKIGKMCTEKIIDFEKFCRQIDKNLLDRATRMDLQLYTKKIMEENICKEEYFQD